MNITLNTSSSPSIGMYRQRTNTNLTFLASLLLAVLSFTREHVSGFHIMIPTTRNARPVTRINSTSRIEGNQREPSEQDIAIMDQMIEKLVAAKPYELPNAVQRAFRVIRSPRFFLRIAELADQTNDAKLKERYNVLSQNLVSTLDAVVSTAQDTLNDCAEAVETIVKAAAEPDTGEFLVPLSAERIAAMKAALIEFDGNDGTSSNDEGFLSTIDAWLNKAHLDGMDGMVQILQNLLQMYAARRVRQTLTTQPSTLLSELLDTIPSEWEAAIRGDTEGATSLVPEIQRNMESLVLSLETGSMRQKVQAEYLQEMVKVAEAVAQ